MKKYPPISDGQVVKIPWRKEDYKMACCDCNLVHRLRFTVKRATLELQAWRDNRATAQLRRKRHVKNDLPACAGTADGPTPARYKWEWKGTSFDFYRLCEILGVSHHAQAHALKKIIRAGRSIKTTEQDIDETISALLRWKEMISEDQENGMDEGRRTQNIETTTDAL